MSRDNIHPPGIREPRRRTWLPYAALAAATVLLGVIVASECRAAVEALVEPDETRTHVIMECKPNQPCAPRGRPVGQTACNMDITGVAITAEKGTRLQCVRVKR